MGKRRTAGDEGGEEGEGEAKGKRKREEDGREGREKRTRMCRGAEPCEVRAHLDLLLHGRTRALTAFHSTIQPPNGLCLQLPCTKVSSFSLLGPFLSLSLSFAFPLSPSRPSFPPTLFSSFTRVDRTSAYVPFGSASVDTNAFYIGSLLTRDHTRCLETKSSTFKRRVEKR